jgi:hypothetical protein
MLVAVIDSDKKNSADTFRLFEGMWLATNPSGTIICAKVVDGKLLIACSYASKGNLTGHYFDCRVAAGRLYCRFENFDSALAGVAFLAVGPDEKLKGGRWANDEIADVVRQDCSQWSEALPGMKPVSWVRILTFATPEWANKYFLEGRPNQP